MSINLTTFAAAETAVRWKEPFITDGLNRKDMALAKGLYRGFRLAAEVGDRRIQILADADLNDHMAVYHTSGGHALTVRKTGGVISPLDLSSYAPTVTVVIAIYATYSVGASTTAVIRSYTQAEFDAAAEKAELLVLGTVLISAAGAIPSANITTTARDSAWENVPKEARKPVNLLTNVGFEMGDTASVAQGSNNQTVPFWTLAPGSANVSMARSTADFRSGTSSLIYTQSSSGAFTTSASQECGVSLYRDAQRLRGRLYYKRLGVCSAGTGITVVATLATSAGSTSNVTLGTPLSLVGGPDASYQLYEFDLDLSVLAAGVGTGIVSFRIDVAATFSSPASGAVLAIDDVELYATTSVYASDEPQRYVSPRAPSITLSSVAQPLFSALSSIGAKIRRIAGGGDIQLEMENQADGSTLGTDMLRWLFEGQIRLGKKLAAATTSAVFQPLLLIPQGALYGRVLVYQNEDGGGGRYVRMYVDSNGIQFLTHNARWDGTNWNKDNSAEFSTLLFASGSNAVAGFARRPGLYRRKPVAGTWSDTQWLPSFTSNMGLATATVDSSNVMDCENGVLYLSNTTSGSNNGDSSINKSGTPLSNALYASNVVKAWGKITTDAAGGATVSDGFNISATVAVTSSLVQISFRTNVSGTSYAVALAGEAINTDEAMVPSIQSLLSTTVSVRTLKIQAAANPVLVDPTAVGFSIYIIVLARQ